MIPLLDLTVQYHDLKPEIDAAMQSAAAGGHYILGPNVKAFEGEVAAKYGCAHGIGVGNGTDALHLALRALRIGPGDEVITSPFTFIATTEAISIVGAKAVFADIAPDTLNLDPREVAARITPRTKAIMPVHIYGHPCDMEPLMELAAQHDLRVIEDCAQAIGARWNGKAVGSWGDVGCFSFFPSKNLGCFGDGGMCLTNDKEWFQRIEMLRRHGGRVKYYHEEIGLNSRLDELQAAILRVKLPHLDNWTNARRAIAARYRAAFAENNAIQMVAEREGAEPVYHQFTLLLNDRDGVQNRLKEAGVQTMVYYPVPLHLQAVHADLGYKAGDFPIAEDAAARCLSLPMYPELSLEDQNRVIEAVREAVA